MRVVVAIVLVMMGLTGVAEAQETITGRAKSVMADMISIDTKRIPLYGIDAPDPDQDRECILGRAYFGCASNARRALDILLDEGPVTCTDSGQKNYIGLPYMVCVVNGKDIGQELVRTGNALAFKPQTDKYLDIEKAARAAKVGIWQDGIRFSIPWEWRQYDGKPLYGP